MEQEEHPMKRTLRKILRFAVPALAFLLQLWRGFRPYGPEPGFTMSGAASEPVAVWISDLLAALAAWSAVELVAFLCFKFLNRRCDRNNS